MKNAVINKLEMRLYLFNLTVTGRRFTANRRAQCDVRMFLESHPVPGVSMLHYTPVIPLIYIRARYQWAMECNNPAEDGKGS